MTYARWHEHSDLRLDLSDIEAHLESIAAFDPGARDLPPQGFGNQVWRTAPEYLNLTIVQGRQLNPDRLAQLFDGDNSLFDAYQLECKPKRKGKGFAPSSRGDTSARDFKLAVGAAKQKFELQEMADLLIGCRAKNNNDFKRRDYYLRTIWRAKEDADRGGDIPTMEEAMGQAAGERQQQHNPNDPSREEILNAIPFSVREAVRTTMTEDELVAKSIIARRLSRNFFRFCGGNRPYLVILIVKVMSEPPQYVFHLDDGGKVAVDGEVTLFNAELMRQAFFGGGYAMPRHKPADWADFIVPCLNALVEVPASIGTTRESELEEYVNNFCRNVRLVLKPEDFMYSQGSPLKEGNRIWLPVQAFLQWVKQNCGVTWTIQEFAKLSDPLGYERKRLRKKGVNCTMALVPEDVLDINEIVDLQSAARSKSKRGDEYVQ